MVKSMISSIRLSFFLYDMGKLVNLIYIYISISVSVDIDLSLSSVLCIL